jgi:LmbE family N-acetylglucosaminyl deacetylase
MITDSPSAILHELEKFRQMGSVLYIAAHPDDENTELLAYLSLGRNYRTAYLSLTRGDGGQNVLGADLREKLGVARTQELLVARQIDGAQQFFSRAIDFGFSKSSSETLNVWNKQEVLSDIVRIIREFRPDVIITRFSPSPGGTHGHHTASAILAMEAFKLAGDPKAFPEQQLTPWQPKRIFWNISTFQHDKAVGVEALKIDVGGKDPVSGQSFLEIAGKSRAMHKTQGFDSFRMPGADNVERLESFHLLDGAPATSGIFEGVDTTWNRVHGGEEIGKAADQIITHFDPHNVMASVPALLKLRSQLSALLPNSLPVPGENVVTAGVESVAESGVGFDPGLVSGPGPGAVSGLVADPLVSVVREKLLQLDCILRACLGLKVETTVSRSDVVPGEALKLHHMATISTKPPTAISVRWMAVRYPGIKKEVTKDIDLHLNQSSSWDSTETLPLSAPLTQPWWLRTEGTPGMFHADDAKLIGAPESPPSFPIENVFEVGGQILVIADQPVQVITNSKGDSVRRRLDVIPPVSLRFVPNVAISTPGASRKVEVEVTASRDHSQGTLQLQSPVDWEIAPPKRPFQLAKAGQRLQVEFTITAPSKSDTAKVVARAEVNGVSCCTQREEINYPHIPTQVIQMPAVLKALSVDLKKRGNTIGYLPGAGDSLPENIKQMGYHVKVLDESKVTPDELRTLDAVVIGVRAFNVRDQIATAMPALCEYAKSGGTVIVQYNRPDKLKVAKIAPYDLHISADRVTDENAPVIFLAPEHPVLNTPNKITSADFDGWVQERGLYFPNQWDNHFTPILAFADPGEAPVKGSLLVAQYGKGYFVYTGLVFFRQLPAGVPGAYRLFANLLSLGK